jgi:hypothetical protein
MPDFVRNSRSWPQDQAWVKLASILLRINRIFKGILGDLALVDFWGTFFGDCSWDFFWVLFGGLLGGLFGTFKELLLIFNFFDFLDLKKILDLFLDYFGDFSL